MLSFFVPSFSNSHFDVGLYHSKDSAQQCFNFPFQSVNVYARAKLCFEYRCVVVFRLKILFSFASFDVTAWHLMHKHNNVRARLRVAVRASSRLMFNLYAFWLYQFLWCVVNTLVRHISFVSSLFELVLVCFYRLDLCLTGFKSDGILHSSPAEPGTFEWTSWPQFAINK